MTTQQQEPREQGLNDASKIDIESIARTLWAYRHVMAAALALVAALYVVGVLAALLVLPTERLASVQFRLLFDGADKNRYPSGAAFSPTEIVSGPVLTDVYATNDLRRFGTYAAFKDSMLVLGSNPEIDFLTYEYQAKLANPRLTSADRTRIEEEFQKKRGALTDPVYSLSIRRRERIKRMPEDLMQKVLLDTLTTWAREAAERRGATGYDIPMLSKNLLQREVIEQEDFLRAADLVRIATNRFLGAVDQLATLPGAHVVRFHADHPSLAEVRARLEDLLRFQLEPLLDIVQSEGITKNARDMQLYLNNQLFQLRLDREKSRALLRALQEALTAFTTPPTGAEEERTASRTQPPTRPAAELEQSFLDRLMALSTAAADQAYRRTLTDRIIREGERLAATERDTAFYSQLANVAFTRARPASTEELAASHRRIATMTKALALTVEQITELYGAIDGKAPGQSATVYAIERPFSLSTQRPLTVATIRLWLIGVLMTTLIAAPIACLLHHATRTRPASGTSVAAYF